MFILHLHFLNRDISLDISKNMYKIYIMVSSRSPCILRVSLRLISLHWHRPTKVVPRGRDVIMNKGVPCVYIYKTGKPRAKISRHLHMLLGSLSPLTHQCRPWTRVLILQVYIR